MPKLKPYQPSYSTAQRLVILEKIYNFYASWSASLPLACTKGCSACCSRNVHMTQLEGLYILAGLENESKKEQFREKMVFQGQIGRFKMSTNSWARRCLQGKKNHTDESAHVLAPCPFLDHQQGCSLYDRRPFACRCFASEIVCTASGEAQQSAALMEINTVTLQIVEHLSRDGLWGNMLDLLPRLLEEQLPPESKKTNNEQGGSKFLHQAEPFPGFLVMPEQQKEVQSYLDDLFAIRLGKSTLGQVVEIAV